MSNWDAVLSSQSVRQLCAKTTEELLGAVFSMRSVLRAHKKTPNTAQKFEFESCMPSEDCYQAVTSEDCNRLREHIL
jgi:hypothetical protein